MSSERPPLAKPLSFEDVGQLEEFRGMSRDQVRHHLLRIDEEVGGRLLSKLRATDGKTHYRVTLASLKAFLPALFPKEEKAAPRTDDHEERIAALEEAVERQAKKLGELTRRLEGKAPRLEPCAMCRGRGSIGEEGCPRCSNVNPMTRETPGTWEMMKEEMPRCR